MKLKFFILLCVFTFSLPLTADENPFRLDGFGEPNTYINGCVNAANGAYIYSFPDIIVEGPEPILFELYFSSKNSKDYGFGKGFTHNYDTHLEKDDKCTLFLKNGGDKIAFVSKAKGEEKCYSFKKKQLKFGMTNCSSGEISARTNIINTKILEKKEGERIVVSGDGSQKFYNRDSYLTKEVRATGNILLYSYDDEGRLKKVSATDSQEQLDFGWMTFDYADDHVLVNASNGKKGFYALSQKKDYKILDCSQVTGIPSCQFHYKKDRLQSIHWEGGNFVSRGKHLGKGRSLCYPNLIIKKELLQKIAKGVKLFTIFRVEDVLNVKRDEKIRNFIVENLFFGVKNPMPIALKEMKEISLQEGLGKKSGGPIQ